jgi:hypothetical protein
MPFPPVIGPLNWAAGPLAGGTRVVGGDGDAVEPVGDVVEAVGVVELEDDEHPASTVSAMVAASTR